MAGVPLDGLLPEEVPPEPVEPLEPPEPLEPLGVPPPEPVGVPWEEPIGLPTWELNPPPPPPDPPPRPSAPVPPPAGVKDIVGGIAIPAGVATAAGTAPVACSAAIAAAAAPPCPAGVSELERGPPRLGADAVGGIEGPANTCPSVPRRPNAPANTSETSAAIIAAGTISATAEALNNCRLQARASVIRAMLASGSSPARGAGRPRPRVRSRH